MDRKEVVQLVLQRTKEGVSTTEIAKELADLKVYNKNGHLADRKYVNNVLLRERLNKPKDTNMSRRGEGCVGQLTSGKWYYRKTYEGKMLVNKYFDSKEEAEEFKQDFMKEFDKGQQPTLFDTENEVKGTKGGKRKGAGRPPKEKEIVPEKKLEKKLEKKTKVKPQLQELSPNVMQQNNDSGFVVIMGKDTNVLKQILSQFEL